MRIRVWPGGTTHRELMERFGFSVATLPWEELDGALRTGLVEGVIGGTPQLATGSFKDLLTVWVQYNDHFEVWWLMMNRALFSSLPPEDQDALLAAARHGSSELRHGGTGRSSRSRDAARGRGGDRGAQ